MSKHTLQKGRKTSSTLAAGSGASAPIPDKLYFRIGDVAKLLSVEAYVLRFWESEFPQLKPNKSGTGQRLYRRRDVELALRIKNLLYVDGYTIAGARQVFATEGQEARQSTRRASSAQQPVAAAQPAAEKRLQQLRGELREILQLLSTPVAADSAKAEKHGERPRTRSRSGIHDIGPGLFSD